MNRHENLIAITFFLMLVCPATQAASCDEQSGAAYVQSGNLDSAYEALRACEKKKGVSAETLTHIALLYGSLDYYDVSEEEALKKVWLLLHRAAALGHEEALESVIRLYAQGEPSLSVRKKDKTQQCLERIGKTNKKDRQKAFEKCFEK